MVTHPIRKLMNQVIFNFVIRSGDLFFSFPRMLQLLLFLVAFSQSRRPAEYESLWNDFKQEHARSYASINEESHRFEIFVDNVNKIDQLNRQYNPVTYFGINHFADITGEELMSYFNHPDF